LKINIFYKLTRSPWGGGNQFLNYLKKKLIKLKLYATVEKSDVIIFNSHHDINKIINLKYKYQNKKTFIHRVDGPISNYRKNGKVIDYIIFKANDYLADGTIFQSHYSLKQTKLLTRIDNPYTVIHNEADSKFFFPSKRKENNKKLKLLSISWSSNKLKGFDFLVYLDKNLDFTKYQMEFVGNSPVYFKNIKICKPMSPKQLGDKIRNSDLFIFPSIYEACSNTLLEVMKCGVPVIVNNSSSNPEIFNNYGELFKGKRDLLNKIYNFQFKPIIVNNQNQPVENLYLNFLKNNFNKKKLSFTKYLFLKILIFLNFIKFL